MSELRRKFGSVQSGWETFFLDLLVPQADYLCSAGAPDGAPPALGALVRHFQGMGCPAKLTCP